MTNGEMWIAPFGEEFAGEKGVFYSFNVEVTGAARLYRAASVWTAGLGLVHQRKRREAAESFAGTECDALKPPT
jgi:hypothetical protein